MTKYSMMIPILWMKPEGETSASMINIEEDKTSTRLGKIRIRVIWSKLRKGKIHQSSEIIPRGIQLKMSPECQKHWEKTKEATR
jgi:hypothetical protein